MPEFHRAVRQGDCDRIIEENLRRVYEMHLKDKVPDQLLVLLTQLRQRQVAA